MGIEIPGDVEGHDFVITSKAGSNHIDSGNPITEIVLPDGGHKADNAPRETTKTQKAISKSRPTSLGEPGSVVVGGVVESSSVTIGNDLLNNGGIVVEPGSLIVGGEPYEKTLEAEKLTKLERYLKFLAKGGSFEDFVADLKESGIFFSETQLKEKYEKIAAETSGAKNWADLVSEYNKKNEAKNLEKLERYLRNLAKGGSLADFRADLMSLGVPFDVEKIKTRYEQVASSVSGAPKWEALR